MRAREVPRAATAGLGVGKKDDKPLLGDMSRTDVSSKAQPLKSGEERERWKRRGVG